jgi:ketosteroid isomerase-like protein
MTLHPNAELLQHSYDAFGRGDMQPLLDLVCDDIEWVDSTLGPLAGTQWSGANDRSVCLNLADHAG